MGRKTLDVYSREGVTLHAPSTPLILGPKRRLTSAKEALYNPCLPTLRRMDMDDVLRKLTDEHSRHSTPCSRGNYELLLRSNSRTVEIIYDRVVRFLDNQVSTLATVTNQLWLYVANNFIATFQNITTKLANNSTYS